MAKIHYFVVTKETLKTGGSYDKYTDPISIEFKMAGDLVITFSDGHVHVYAPGTVHSFHSIDAD